MQLPLGFTDISLNYLPLVPVPDISSTGTKLGGVTSLNNFTYNPGTSLPLNILPADQRWFINLDYSFDYASKDNVTRFPIINFYCQLGDRTTNKLVGGGIPIYLQISNTDKPLINIPISDITKTNDNGLCAIPLQLNFITTPITTLTFVAVLATDQNIIDTPPSLLSTEDITGTKSNLVTIQTSSFNSIVSKFNTDQELDLQNTTLNLVDNLVIESVQQQSLNLSTSIANLEIYGSPYDTCATSEIEASSRLVQGFTKNEICRYSGWGNKVLAEVHSHVSANQNSEVNITDKIVTTNSSQVGFVKDSGYTLNRYKKILELESQHIVANTQSYLSTQTNQGNNVSQANVQQVHGQHIRHNAGANYDVHAGGKISLVGNQVFTNARWINVASDTKQQIVQHYWLRSEGLNEIISKDTIRFNYNSLQEYSGNTLNATGQNVQYSDVLWNQIGQIERPPLHPSRSVKSDHKYNGSKPLVYGTAVNLSMQDYHICSKYGSIKLKAAQHIKFVSDSGGFLFKALSGDYKVDTSSVTVKTIKRIKLESASKVIISAPQVLINCASAASFDDVFDYSNVTDTVKDINKYVKPAEVIGKSINSASQVIDQAGNVIAKAVQPIINTVGQLQHSIIDQTGKVIGQATGVLGDKNTIVEPYKVPQLAINQSLVFNRESLSEVDLSGYLPMVFSSLEDPASTEKSKGGNTTGSVLQTGSNQPNPNSINFAGPAGSGAAL